MLINAGTTFSIHVLSNSHHSEMLDNGLTKKKPQPHQSWRLIIYLSMSVIEKEMHTNTHRQQTRSKRKKQKTEKWRRTQRGLHRAQSKSMHLSFQYIASH